MKFKATITKPRWEQERYKRGARKGQFKPGGHRRYIPSQVITEVLDRTESLFSAIYKVTNLRGVSLADVGPDCDNIR
jgi:hypothetical protein